MAAAFSLYKTNRLPIITDTITTGGAAVDLTGASVKLKMRLETSATLKVNAAATIESPATAGNVSYAWDTADVDTAGGYVAWWEVTKSGKTQDTPEFDVVIREHGLASGSLCSLADVREGLELPATQTNRDALIETLIEAASPAICEEAGREFSPSAENATRRFRVDGCLVDLAPYDLRNIDTITLHPEASSPTVLTTADWRLEPVPARYGVYQRVRLSPWVHLHSSDTANRFGYAYLDIVGDWGFSAVPKVVRQAAVVTVCSWLRRDIAQFAMQTDDPFAAVAVLRQANYSIPPAALKLLGPFSLPGFA